MRKAGVILFAGLAVMLFISCGKASKEGAYAADKYQETLMAAPRAAMTEAAYESTAADDLAPADTGSARKLIQTAHIAVSTAQVLQFNEQVRTKIAELQGFTESSRQSNNSDDVVSYIDMTVKIPAENFDAFIAWLEANGKIGEKSLQTQDVTDRYYDLEARIKNREILLVAYRGFLKDAKVMKDILDVSERINSLTYEIEQMKGSLLSLDRAVSYSTVNLTIVNSAVNSPSTYSFGARVREFGATVTAFFASAFFVILYIAVFGTAAVLFAALVFYLTFGKVGLIRRLFKKLK